MQVTLDLEPTSQTLHDLFVTAMEGGISYWALIEKYKWSHGKPAYDPDLETFSATLWDPDNERQYKVTKATIRQGIRNGLAKKNRFTTKIVELLLDPEGVVFDADEADKIVQLGIFNNIIYG